ncbi:MAG: class I SAM-dependent methyltransferase [Methylococcaceae bacterium]
MINRLSKSISLASKVRKLFRFNSSDDYLELNDYIKEIDAYNAAQSNFEMLDAIRQYNHYIINSLNSIRPLSGLRILDVGASPHGYALEESLALGVSEYVGIGLDISEDFSMKTETARGSLAYMNAESLSFKDNEFDVIVTMSTFEHIGDVSLALAEFHRVLKPSGYALISFEPIWTCSYGHHLHHLGEISKLVPDWAHLMWSKNEMMEHLKSCWPPDAPLNVQEACDWIYDDNVLNRKGISEIRTILSESQMQIEWIIPMMDESRNDEQLTAAAKITGLSREDLMSKGLSILLYKL